jgi:hypothetical protein
MSRKSCRRTPVVALPPRGLRPRFKPDELRALSLTHIACIDAMARGQADEFNLSKWILAVHTWAKVAETLGEGLAEMRAQLGLVDTVSGRFLQTGRAVFTGPEYQLAKAGLGYMDDLAKISDRSISDAANLWVKRYLARTHAQAQAPKTKS